MNKQKLFFRLFAYIALVLCIWSILYISGVRVSDLSPEKILKMAHHNTALILIIMLIVMSLQNIFTFIPLILVITVNIALFGFWQGYLYSSFCSVFGSTVMFLSIRYLFSKMISSSKLQKYQQKVEKNGFLFVLTSRIFPFIPTNLINIVSGLSSMKVSHFIYATTIGNMIYGLVLSLVSYGILSVSSFDQLLIIIPILIMVLAIILSLIIVKKRRQPKIS